ncbi:MAG: putative glycoside hydrolase, partial [Hungatella sp.]
MKKIGLLILCMLILGGCSRYERIDDLATTPEPIVVRRGSDEAAVETETAPETIPPITITAEPAKPERIPVKVKGIYVSAYVAGTASMMDNILAEIDRTEINAIVIDVKDDNGRITFSMDSPIVSELGAEEVFIPDIEGLMKKLKEHHIYTIARVVAFRDPYLAEQKPELSLKLADGSTYRDNKGLAWVNPYKTEVWDYLVEVGIEAHKAGFDEVQFDYIRFSTEKGMKDVVYEETDTNGRSKTQIITEFITYAYEKLEEEGIFVAADVFGAIMGGGQDSDSVGQSYGEMAKHLDYICPMIYPSHYGDGNFGIDHPDTQPYDTILAALRKSQIDLKSYEVEGKSQAIVRPWLQDFTASYLAHHIPYGDQEIRAQIQAVYDAGYDEWILWSAACKYHWGGLKTPEEAEAELRQIAESRAAEPETTIAETTATAETTVTEETTTVAAGSSAA